MTLTITDAGITSDVTSHTAQRVNWREEPGWRVSWLPDRLLSRNEAITGMTIAEHAGPGPGPLVNALAGELGLTGPEAIRLAMAPSLPAEADGASDADVTYRREYEAVWGATVRALTTAVRLRHPRSGELDFAGFLGGALAAVAGNVGSADRIVAGRSGSWEADLVAQLTGGTVGYDQDELALARYRTEPVVVPLNVHELMLDGGVETPYEKRRYEIYEQLLGDFESDDEYEAALEEANAEAAIVEARWGTRYAAYAEAFAAALAQEAAQIEGLRVPVTLRANTALDGAGPDGLYDPDTENPDEYDPDADLLVFRLWDAARRAVPLPTEDSTAESVETAPPTGTSAVAGLSRITVAGFTVRINRSASGQEATS